MHSEWTVSMVSVMRNFIETKMTLHPDKVIWGSLYEPVEEEHQIMNLHEIDDLQSVYKKGLFLEAKLKSGEIMKAKIFSGENEIELDHNTYLGGEEILITEENISVENPLCLTEEEKWMMSVQFKQEASTFDWNRVLDESATLYVF